MAMPKITEIDTSKITENHKYSLLGGENNNRGTKKD